MTPENGTMQHNRQGSYAAEVTSGTEVGRVIRALRRRWWLVVLGGALAFGAAWYLIPPGRTFYSAAAVVRLLDAPSALPLGLPTGVLESARTTEFMVSQVHVARSRTVIGDVVDREGLRLRPSGGLPASLLRRVSVEGTAVPAGIDLEFTPSAYVAKAGGKQVRAAYGEVVEFPGVRFAVARAPEVPEAHITVLPREQAIDAVLLSLSVEPRERAAILDIEYTDADAGRAQAVVNAIASSFQLHNARGVQEAARRRREFLEEQVLQAEVRAARAQQDLTEFRRAGSGNQQRLASEQTDLLALETERNRLEADYEMYRDFVSRVERARDEEIDEELRTIMATPGSTPSPLLTQLYTQLTTYQTERNQQLAEGLAPTHPNVQRLTTLIRSARGAVAEAARSQLSSIGLRLASLGDRRTQAAAMLERLPDSGAEEARLAREVDAALEATQNLREQYQQARMTESVELGQVDILDYASGARPIETSRTRYLALALIFGLLLGTGGALGLEATNTRIRTLDDTHSLLRIPELAVIPSGSQRPRAGRLLGRGSRASVTHQLADEKDFHSLSAEAYRRLRTNLIFLNAGAGVKTMVITSALAGEGKSTTAANLAISFAREGRRVLLIDCDLRRPQLHKLFEAGDGPGFTDVLLGRVNGDAPAPFSPREGLDFLPRGEYDERAGEVLTGPRMGRLMAGFRETYDLVILDTPPVLLAAEAAVLAGLADGVLLVVRAGASREKAVRDALQQLEIVQANVVGFVLNDPDAVAEHEGGYGYSKEYYSVEY